MDIRYAVILHPFIMQIPVFPTRAEALRFCQKTADDMLTLYPTYLNYTKVGNIALTDKHLINSPNGMTVYSAEIIKQELKGAHWTQVPRHTSE